MSESRSANEQFLDTVHQIIDENIDNEAFSVEKLAKDIGLSRSMLHRKLMQLSGRSASSMIMDLRLARAKELLENKVATVSEIAYQVGFSSPSYFNKVFKKHYGLCPGDVKKGGPLPTSLPHSTLTKRRLIYVLASISGAILLSVAIIYLSRDHSPIDKSIAVLPFDNLNSQEETGYFADGMVDDLLSKLSKINGLKVISRTSSEVYRVKGGKSLPQIANELGVSYILEGSIQKDDRRIRIHVQLIDAERDDHVWSNTYNRDLTDFFQIQSEIALKVASELNTVLTQQQISSIQNSFTGNTRAFELYQLGHIIGSERTKYAYEKSIEYYKQAIELDSKYALAYAGIADTYHLMALQDHIDLKEGINEAREMAERALEEDPNLAEAIIVIASIDAYVDHNWDLGMKKMQEAIRLNPNFSTAYQYYSELLFITGKYDEATFNIDRALDLDPFSNVIRMLRTRYLFLLGHYNQALYENSICLSQVQSHPWSLRMQVMLLYKLNRDQELIAALKALADQHQNYPASIIESVYHSEGPEGLLGLEGRTEKDPDLAFRWYALSGNYDRAFERIDEADQKISVMWVRSLFSEIADQPRYLDLLSRNGLRP